MDIVRAHRPCAVYSPPCILGAGVPKHHNPKRDADSAESGNDRTRDAYSFVKERLAKDGPPQCSENKHAIDYIDHVRERLAAPSGDVCKPW